MSRASPGKKLSVILGVGDGFVPPGRLSAWQQGEQRANIARAQNNLLEKLPRGKFRQKRRFHNIPFLAVEIDGAQVHKLQSIPEITSIEEDVLDSPSLASTNPVIGSPAAWEAGFDGEGWVVAVLDTGVDRSHPYFSRAQKILAEACFSTNLQLQGAMSVCPDGVEESTAYGSAAPCGTSDCDHGTTIAGIVAGNDFTGPNYGVARGAELIPIQVFSDIVSAEICGSSRPCSKSYESDQVKALDHVYDLSAVYDIAAVNLSLGGGAHTGYCDDSEYARKAAIDALRSVGIATVAPAGNSGLRDAMQSPACISSAVGVAASTEEDEIAGFSNISMVTSLLAPGVDVTASAPGGGTQSLSGTSVSVPQVAGAWAILKEKYPGASVEEVLRLLSTTGTRIDDHRSGGIVVDIPRINVDRALGIDPAGPQSIPSGAYVPMAGCRIVDTRIAALTLAPAQEYPFFSGKVGQQLVGQGGIGAGCSIPENAVAIQVNFSVIAQGSAGYLRAWPSGFAEPNATLLAWSGGPATNALLLPICATENCNRDIIVKMYGTWESVELVIDVFGYYK